MRPRCSREEFDEHVLGRLSEIGPYTYPACQGRRFFRVLGLPWNLRSDVFAALARLREAGYVERKESGRTKVRSARGTRRTARMVTYIALPQVDAV